MASASAMASPLFTPAKGGNSARPNVVLIMADDLGYADIGCYGSEIRTPTIDRLGRAGLRFTEFYNMAKCGPSRSSLMTGLYFQKRNAGNAESLGSLMRDAGYYAAMSGKEHFSKWSPRGCYAEHAFDDSFVFWACTQYFEPPSGFRSEFKLNGKVVNPGEIPISRKPFYKTDVITDYALRFLDKARDNRNPFFLYLPYHVGHYPLQARPQDIGKYRDVYRKGWDKIRRERFARQRELGILPPNTSLSEPQDNVYPHRGGKNWADYTPWDQLSEDLKEKHAERMAVYAGMIDRMDRNIDRVIRKIDEMGQAENTLVLFLVDNGACPYDNGNRGDPDAPIGSARSYNYLPPEWACAGNTPWRYYKQYGYSGGSRTPLIAYWPGVIEPGITHQPGHLVDLLPTILEVADRQYPETARGKPTPALDGKSLMPIFVGKTREQPELIIGGYGSHNRMVQIGNWKAVCLKRKWHLYNAVEDPSEINNLAGKHPETLQKIIRRYRAWRQGQR